jgi:hypothetical protein
MAGMESYSRYSYERQSNVDCPKSKYGSGEVLSFPEGGLQERFSPKPFEDAIPDELGEFTFCNETYSSLYVYEFFRLIVWVICTTIHVRPCNTVLPSKYVKSKTIASYGFMTYDIFFMCTRGIYAYYASGNVVS